MLPGSPGGGALSPIGILGGGGQFMACSTRITTENACVADLATCKMASVDDPVQ